MFLKITITWLYLVEGWPGGIDPLPGGLTNYCPSVLWHCWLGHLTCKIIPDMTYNVFGGTLTPTQSISYPLLCMLNDFIPWYVALMCRHVVKLEKEAVDLGLVATTTAKPDEPATSDEQNAVKS